MLATNGNHTKVVQYLTSLSNVKIYAKDKYGGHAALNAAINGRLDVLKLLVQKDPNVADLKGNREKSPLVVAARKGDLDIVKYLTSQQNVNKNSQDGYGATPLIWAAYYNHPKVVQLLLEKGADTSVKDNNGYTALEFAKDKGYTYMIKLLQKSK